MKHKKTTVGIAIASVLLMLAAGTVEAKSFRFSRPSSISRSTFKKSPTQNIKPKNNTYNNGGNTTTINTRSTSGSNSSGLGSLLGAGAIGYMMGHSANANTNTNTQHNATEHHIHQQQNNNPCIAENVAQEQADLAVSGSEGTNNSTNALTEKCPPVNDVQLGNAGDPVKNNSNDTNQSKVIDW